MSNRIGEARNTKDLLSALKVAVERREMLRRPYEKIWWDNLALIAGDHWAAWDPRSGLYMERDTSWRRDDQKKPKLVLNHALTVKRTELSKLTKSRPIMDVMANSDEDIDLAATKVGLAVLDFIEWKFNRRKERKQALSWMISTGLAAVFVGWDWYNEDPGHMNFTIDPVTGEPTFNEARKEELSRMVSDGTLDESDVQVLSYPLGDLDFKVYSPFQLLPDENALDFDRLNDLITVDTVDYDVACGLWDEAKKCVPEDVTVGAVEKRNLMRSGLAGPGQQELENGLKVYTWWCLPNVYRDNKFLARGKMIRWAQGEHKLEETEVFPFDDNRMPFAFYQHIPSDATVWPESIMQHIRGANLEIDKTVSQLLANKDYMGNPMWRVATQHQIKGKIRNVAGSIVRYVHVPNIPPPEPLPGIPMPAQVENLVQALRSQILDISGQSEATRGRVPTGVRSGVAVAYLQEEDDSKIAPTSENYEMAVAHESSLCLTRVQQFYTTERIVRYYRRDGTFDALKFKGADLKNNTDVIALAGSALPKSKAARQQFVLELIQLGIEQDPRKIKQMLDLGEGEPDDLEKAIRQADRENQKMLHGMQRGMFKLSTGANDQEVAETVNVAIPVKAWHNHQIHLQRHYSIMMDEEYDRLTVSHPEITRVFEEHITMHQQQIAAQQQAQMQMLMAAKGAPDGPPGSSPNAAQNGADQSTMMAQSETPDVIGGGQVRMTTRNISPTPGGGGQ
jgi:hypothetical protein